MFKYIVKINDYVSYCLNLQDAHDHLEKFQVENHLRFSLIHHDENFGNIDVLAQKRKLFWSEKDCDVMDTEIMPFDGVPFFVLGKKIYSCDIGRRTLLKRKENGQLASSPFCCPAKSSIFEIVKFPQHMIEHDDIAARESLVKKLKEDLSVGKALAERRFYVFFPRLIEHRYHLVVKDGNFVQPEDLEVEEEINKDVQIELLSSSEVAPLNSNLAQHCIGMLEMIKDKTYTSDETTLAFGRIVLKDILLRLQTLNESAFSNAVSEKT